MPQKTVHSPGKLGPCTFHACILGLEHGASFQDQFRTAASPQLLPPARKKGHPRGLSECNRDNMLRRTSSDRWCSCRASELTMGIDFYRKRKEGRAAASRTPPRW
jgi:hypothetical protein